MYWFNIARVRWGEANIIDLNTQAALQLQLAKRLPETIMGWGLVNQPL